MERLLEIHERAGRHLAGNQVNMLVPDYVEISHDFKTGMTIHSVFTIDDLDPFALGYDAVRRVAV